MEKHHVTCSSFRGVPHPLSVLLARSGHTMLPPTRVVMDLFLKFDEGFWLHLRMTLDSTKDPLGRLALGRHSELFAGRTAAGGTLGQRTGTQKRTRCDLLLPACS